MYAECKKSRRIFSVNNKASLDVLCYPSRAMYCMGPSPHSNVCDCRSILATAQLCDLDNGTTIDSCGGLHSDDARNGVGARVLLSNDALSFRPTATRQLVVANCDVADFQRILSTAVPTATLR